MSVCRSWLGSLPWRTGESAEIEYRRTFYPVLGRPDQCVQVPVSTARTTGQKPSSSIRTNNWA